MAEDQSLRWKQNIRSCLFFKHCITIKSLPGERFLSLRWESHVEICFCVHLHLFAQFLFAPLHKSWNGMCPYSSVSANSVWSSCAQPHFNPSSCSVVWDFFLLLSKLTSLRLAGIDHSGKSWRQIFRQISRLTVALRHEICHFLPL